MDNQKSSIVSALEVLESIKISFNKPEVNEDNYHLRHISALTNVKDGETNVRGSIIEQNIDANVIKEAQFEDTLNAEKTTKSRDLSQDKRLAMEKKTNSTAIPQKQEQKQAILKSNSSNIKTGDKQSKDHIGKSSTKEEKASQFAPSGKNHGSNTNPYNVYSPKGSKNIQFHENKPNPKNIINNEKLHKSKETITYEEKKMADKRVYESSHNTIDKPRLSDKNVVLHNSNSNLISLNPTIQTIGEKPTIGLNKGQANQLSTQYINKSSGFKDLSLQKVFSHL